MKVLYLTVPSYFDLEISLIRELSKKCEITVLMIVSPESMKSSAFSIEKLLPVPTIAQANDYPGMEEYDNLINLQQWYIANNPDNSILSCLRLAHQIKSFIKKGNFDILHSTTNCKTTFFLLPFFSKLQNKLYTVHDPISHNRQSKIRDFFRIKLYYSSFKDLLLLSPSLIKQFKSRYKGWFDTIFYSNLGPYDYLTQCSALENNYKKYILFFGRVSYYKGVDLLIKAYPKSEYYANGYKLLIVGKGNVNSKDIEQNSNIIYINRYIANSELANFIRDSDSVVLPYRTATQSGCVMSAFAFNKPILATNVGDLPLSVTNDITGIIIEPDSEEEVVRGLNKMYHTDRTKMSENIRKQYNEHGPNSWKQIANNLIDIYNKIMTNR